MNTRLITKSRIAVAGVVVAVAATAIAAPAAVGDREVNASATTISVRDDFYSPKSKSVSRNATVTWRWRGSNEHNVRFRSVPSGASKRGAGFKTSGSFSKTMTKRGTYRYICTLHVDEGMRGSVSVK